MHTCVRGCFTCDSDSQQKGYPKSHENDCSRRPRRPPRRHDESTKPQPPTPKPDEHHCFIETLCYPFGVPTEQYGGECSPCRRLCAVRSLSSAVLRTVCTEGGNRRPGVATHSSLLRTHVAHFSPNVLFRRLFVCVCLSVSVSPSPSAAPGTRHCCCCGADCVSCRGVRTARAHVDGARRCCPGHARLDRRR